MICSMSGSAQGLRPGGNVNPFYRRRNEGPERSNSWTELASLTSSQVIRQTCLIQSVLCLPMVIRLQALIFPRRFRIFFPLKHLPNGGGAQKHNFWAVFYKKNH